MANLTAPSVFMDTNIMNPFTGHIPALVDTFNNPFWGSTTFWAWTFIICW